MKVYTTRWRILEFIRNFVEEKGYAPTQGEIQKALGISSGSVVDYHLKALEEEGVITREPEVARGIQVSGIGKRARAVPLLGTIAAGQPIPVPTEETWHTIAQETVEVPAEMLPRQIRAYALRVKGTSMIDAFVDDGDIVVLEPTRTADDGEMVAAWLTERQEATLKKLYREPGRLRLQPANRSMAPIYADPDQIEVQGRVIGVLRKYSQGSL
jgi:repressor LexA